MRNHKMALCGNVRVQRIWFNCLNIFKLLYVIIIGKILLACWMSSFNKTFD